MKILSFVFAVLMLAFLVTKSFAYDLGVMGETYPIIEVDFLQFIQSRVDMMQKNGQWQSLQRHIQRDAIHYRDRPKVVAGLVRATETKIWKFDPSIVLDHDVTTPEGKLIAMAGTHVNPLIYVSLSKALIFYNADDPDQVKWAIQQDKKLKGHDKLILVNGSVLIEEKRFKNPIYFDQSGRLTSRFGITHVPAIVVQDGLALRIKEESI